MRKIGEKLSSKFHKDRYQQWLEGALRRTASHLILSLG